MVKTSKEIHELFNIDELVKVIQGTVYQILEFQTSNPCQIYELVSGSCGREIPQLIGKIFGEELDINSLSYYLDFENLEWFYNQKLYNAINGKIHPKIKVSFGYYDYDGSYGVNLEITK